MATHFFNSLRRMNPAIAGTLTLAGLLTSMAFATDLPPAVVNYAKAKDPNVKIRFDGLMVFSNGESYVPVIPQDPSLAKDPQHVILATPDKAVYPDLVEFDNHFFLLRLIQTASGRMTFPKLEDYPIQLKEGLLPQDFVLPNNLYIPVELKVILGALPYNPNYTVTKIPVPQTPFPGKIPPKLSNAAQRTLYLFNLNEQKLVTVNSGTGEKIADVPLECMPSGLTLSEDGKLLFAPCLAANEMAVLDTASGLIKTRIPVGQRPQAALVVPGRNQVLVSHRFSDFLSVIKTDELLPGDKITLPGNAGAMAVVPAAEGPSRSVIVANAVKPEVYLVNLEGFTVDKTIPTLPNISAAWVSPGHEGAMAGELWVASRSNKQVQVIDLADNKVLKTFDVGDKPVEFGVFENRLYVVSAGSDRIDIIDWKTKAQFPSINLTSGSFPAGMSMAPLEKRAYVVAAGNENLFVINLEDNTLETSVPVAFRAGAITLADLLPLRSLPKKPAGAPGGTVKLTPPPNTTKEAVQETNLDGSGGPDGDTAPVTVEDLKPSDLTAEKTTLPGSVPNTVESVQSVDKPAKKGLFGKFKINQSTRDKNPANQPTLLDDRVAQ